ncbi:hypothetical protein CYMTET_34718 [Cymbomonas tetramitiformis]|uniref:Glycosyl transferase CAP10 domain-containing protein n=1 Tax=Cymbomonas tetramitiformis TaxID=36881 RepID=A0AAE0FAK2_9CHLO|nr:hypothetical protein CYMTET_34718 [Cymbomonas tetramitiformis]
MLRIRPPFFLMSLRNSFLTLLFFISIVGPFGSSEILDSSEGSSGEMELDNPIDDESLKLSETFETKHDTNGDTGSESLGEELESTKLVSEEPSNVNAAPSPQFRCEKDGNCNPHFPGDAAASCKGKCTLLSWIKEDLQPWSTSGITLEMLKRAHNRGERSSRFLIKNGTLYASLVLGSSKWGASRTWYSAWALLELLDKYGTEVPDVEFVISVEDEPHVRLRPLRLQYTLDAPFTCMSNRANVETKL